MVDTQTGVMKGRLLPSQFMTIDANELDGGYADLGALSHYFKPGAVIKPSNSSNTARNSGTYGFSYDRPVSVVNPPVGNNASSIYGITTDGRKLEVPTVRQVAVLLHNKLLEAQDPVRHMKTSFDNTLYLYPTIFERFQHRNLCVKVQLVEFEDTVVGPYPDPRLPYRVLRNIYNTMIGPAFITGAFTTVSYHNKNPVFNDEIKIRLPDVITDNHWLIITAQHVHVKQKTANKSFFDVLSLKPEELLDVSATILGAGFLKIMTKEKTLLADTIHSVTIIDFNDAVNTGIAYPARNTPSKAKGPFKYSEKSVGR